jgi:ribosomal protein S18 acetylase RimI-like enzyme
MGLSVSLLHFRPATAADVGDLVALVTASYRGPSSRAGWTTEADLLDGNRVDPELLAADIARDRSVVLIAEQDGAMIACAHVAVVDDAGYFGMFAVRPTLQRAGTGHRVLAEAERIARDDFGMRRMRMSVIDVRSELIDWYLRRGYRRTGEYRPFPYGDPRFGDPKRPDLRFEVLEKDLTGGQGDG